MMKSNPTGRDQKPQDTRKDRTPGVGIMTPTQRAVLRLYRLDKPSLALEGRARIKGMK